ncbi:MAG: esterase [Catalinimonas sp.]
MKEEYYRWYSHPIGRDFEMLVFGHAGYPVVLFPTSRGRYYENKDFGLIGAVGWLIDQGRVRIYCPDSIDGLSWYNRSIHPADRIRNHLRYEQVIRDEVIGRARWETGRGQVAVAGCSFGAYHATCFGFRHLDLVSHVFNMGGAFNIKPQLDGYYSEDAYFVNPVDFIPNLNDHRLYHKGLTFGCGEWDFCRPSNEHLSGVLRAKGVGNWLDVRPGYEHNWEPWKVMFPDYLAQL